MRSAGLASAGVTPGAGEGVSAVKGAAAKCIYLLYGLDLPEQDHQWTDGFQVSMQKASLLLCTVLRCFVLP